MLESTESHRLPAHKSILYLPSRDSFKELWDGPTTGPEDAVDLLGVDEAYPMDKLERDLSEKYSTHGFVVWCYRYPTVHPELQTKITKALQSSPRASISKYYSYSEYLDAVRVFKSESEVELMKTACDISAEAFKETMRVTHPGMWEYQLESTMEHAAVMKGAYSLSFPPVVAGGDRGCHIHYIRNDNLLKNGELVLMDAGVDYHGYLSDITRTWPTNGQFSSSQEELYGSLLELQQTAIQECRMGMSLNYLHHKSSERMGALLTKLKIVSSGLSSAELREVIDKLYPHHISHYLGMEVHDSIHVSRNVKLEPGMVVTVEPGIYIPRDFADAGHSGPNAKHFAGTAIRIEDNVLITADGNDVLSKATPKEISELTTAMSS